MYQSQSSHPKKPASNQQDELLFEIFKWLSFALALLLALLSVLSSSFFSFVLFLLAAMLLFAPANKYLKSQIPFLKNKVLKGISLLSLVAIGFLFLKIQSPNRPYLATKKTKIKTELKAADISVDTILIEEPKTDDDIVQQRIAADDASFWNDYDTIVKEKIYKLIVEKDCKGLQLQFNTAYNNNNSQLRRIGKTNSDLLSFIDKTMRDLDCY